MIKELIGFMKSLDEDFKSLGAKSKEGLHIFLQIKENGENIYLDLENIQYERYTVKISETNFLEKCKALQTNSWCIDTNKCFDLPTKAIQSCSPYSVGFKREHLDGGEKYAENKKNKKRQVDERFGDYFAKSFKLLKTEEEKQKYEVFKGFFTQKNYEDVLKKIEQDFISKNQSIDEEINLIKNQQSQSKDKDFVKNLKTKIDDLEKKKETSKMLSDSDYIIFYLDEPLEKYKEAHQKYLFNNLFNTSEDTTKPDENGEIFGTSGFFNGFNIKKPLLIHQTATFDISNRISSKEARLLYEFEQILPRKVLPNPLPLFIFKEELLLESIGIIKENINKIGYKEIIEELYKTHKDDIGDYYLLFYQNTKDGLIFKDFDFVSKFEYELKDENNENWEIQNLFEVNEYNKKELKPNIKIDNIFHLESSVFNYLIGDKYKKIDYFGDLDSKSYEKMENTFLLFSKYRKGVYDFVYKSKKTTIQEKVFSEMVFLGIKDNLKQGEIYRIKEKLNIWFSLYEKFNLNFNITQEKTMASKLKEYQQFVEELAENKANIDEVSAEQFAFAAGQVIYYIFKKSNSDDTSYQRLEPYLQQSTCEGIKKAIANDFAKYKHENYSGRFQFAAAFVLSYQSNANMKHLLPEILAGVFANNQLYPIAKEKNNNQ